MTLLSCIIIQILWAFCAKGQEVRCDPPSVNNGTYVPQMRVFREKDVIRVECNRGFHFENENRQNTAECTRDGWLPNPRCILRPCENPHLENGELTHYYDNYEERAFPARLGSSIYYRCLAGYVSKSKEKWNLITCTKEGWDPMPKCLRICSVRYLENGAFQSSYWKTYKEGDEISYVCDDEYSPENHQAKVTCTKNDWSPTPRCIFNKRCEKIEIQNGYFYESTNRFNLNEAAAYGCQIGYKTPEGNEIGKTQCLPEGWSPFPKCIGPACEKPPVIDFGAIVSGDKLEYRESDKVQYKCNPGFSLTGPEWITCSRKTWTPAPQCLAPCSITKQQLEAKNLLLSNGRRHAQLIQSDHTLGFMCSEGYALTIPSVRKCVNGHMDLPSCISETGKNCSRPPTAENGDITTFLEKEYTSGSFVEFKCQKFYAMEGQNISFCDNGNWTKAPRCLEPCAISVEEMENQMIELNGRTNENILRSVYVEHGDFLELRCKPGYSLATNLSQSTFMVECNGNPIVYPECKEIVCDPPGVVNGSFRPQRNKYRDGDIIIIACNHGFHSHNGHNTAECTKNGWLPTPRCSNTQD